MKKACTDFHPYRLFEYICPRVIIYLISLAMTARQKAPIGCRVRQVRVYLPLPKLTGIEPFTVSLVACIRSGLRSFLQGVSLAANSHFPAQINRRQKLSDLQI